MIVLFIFGIIIALSVALSMYNSNNHDTIKEYYQINECKAVSYYQGKYLGVCNDKIIMYQNSFVLDMQEPTVSISLNIIKNVELIQKQATANSNEKNNILLTLSNNQNLMLEFENEEQLKQFKGALNQ